MITSLIIPTGETPFFEVNIALNYLEQNSSQYFSTNSFGRYFNTYLFPPRVGEAQAEIALICPTLRSKF